MQHSKHKTLFTLSALGLAISMATANADNREIDEAQAEVREATHEMKHEANEMKHEANETGQEYSGALRNAWIHGKLETAYLLNGHLNNFAINSRVEGETAYLTGTVESDIDRDLAEEVAMNIDGISRVENDLKVDPDNVRDDDVSETADRTLAQRLEDATTTAVVKSKLLANEHTGGFDINVDTRNDVVTLRGSVDSAEEKSLAQEVAANTDDVESVVNQLVIKNDS